MLTFDPTLTFVVCDLVELVYFTLNLCLFRRLLLSFFFFSPRTKKCAADRDLSLATPNPDFCLHLNPRLTFIAYWFRDVLSDRFVSGWGDESASL